MRVFVLLAAILLAACQSRDGSLEDLRTRTITLPNGSTIVAEVVIDPIDMARGLMFRDNLPRGHGMLFIHQEAGPQHYWMYQVKIPLDIIFMDSQRRIAEISANTPPCTTGASQCPTYGSFGATRYVLELGGGEAQRLGLKTGDTLTF
jgi:uncharacterized membrane protein (UPF0127 family)